ncbi:hypothetical protein I302_102471 [Kwoniella bestiolae CBS 10118]|uniref:Uncharacterized protein n=1 Tax=Kwoniella bestiolae CBS 10118 TaxID=1296100 RepID=A0A1B9GFD0_9TREE|nr:hypothetical protein I302_01161 [Kwoniella bestiolae CBS 10118]OCF29651.1 hypothetical protein I302_01161 [Kwoniella bestiolae CBS 10118]
MQIPASTLFLLLFSLTSLVDAKYRPPSTASPDYQKCKHGVDSDPSCIPTVSDESVSLIRDSKGRFLLLNEKHPELKSHIRQQTRSPYVAPTSTIVVPTTPMVPALVAPELSTAASTPTSLPLMKKDSLLDRSEDMDMVAQDEEGDRKFGGASSWARPFMARYESTDGPEQEEMVGDEKFAIAKPFRIKRDTNHFSLPSIPFIGYGGGNDFSSVPPIGPDGAQDIVASISTSEEPGSMVDLIGNLKFGYGGGWGRPWRRSPAPAPAPKDCLEETTIISTATATATATATVIQIQTQTITATPTPTTMAVDMDDNTGNAKFGYGGGYGRPWKRQDQPAESIQENGIEKPEEAEEDTGNVKFGYGGGWGRPWKRQGGVDGLSEPLRLPAQGGDGDQKGNMKFGYGGGWGRPWKRQADEPSGDDTGNMKFGYGGGYGRPW